MRRFLSAWVGSVIALIIFLAPVSDAIALQSSQFIEKPAVLTGPKEGAPIPLYIRPAANQPPVGYGDYGSTVTVIEQVASFLPEADQNSAWNHIRLEDKAHTEGWVQGRFLEMTNPSSPE